MIDIDWTQLEADRAAGTPGDWRIIPYDCGDVTYWPGTPMIDGPEDYDCAVIHWAGFEQEFWQSAHGDRRAINANARRIARVPDLEAYALRARKIEAAADDLANAVINERENVCQDIGKQIELSRAVDDAIRAYQAAKGGDA